MPKAWRRAEKLAAQAAYNATCEGQEELKKKMEEKKLRKMWKYDRNKLRNAATNSRNTSTLKIGSVNPKQLPTKKKLWQEKLEKKAALKAKLIASVTVPGMSKYQIRKAVKEQKLKLKELMAETSDKAYNTVEKKELEAENVEMKELDAVLSADLKDENFISFASLAHSKTVVSDEAVGIVGISKSKKSSKRVGISKSKKSLQRPSTLDSSASDKNQSQRTKSKTLDILP